MDLDALLRCPRCKGPLVRGELAYECHRCRVRYLELEGVVDFVPGDAEPFADDGRGPPRRE